MSKKGNKSVRDVAGQGTLIGVPEIHVASWSPSPPGSNGATTQVHLIIKVREIDSAFIVRYQTRAGLQRLIDNLIEYRDEVWPQ